MLMKPIAVRESAPYFKVYWSCSVRGDFTTLAQRKLCVLHQPAGTKGGKDHGDGAAARSMAENPKKPSRKISGVGYISGIDN